MATFPRPSRQAGRRPARPRSKAYNAFFDELGTNNPVFVQILGICSTLAVTNVVTNTVVMCLGLIWATAMSNVSVSILRKWIPARVRMIVETLIIAVWVIIVDIVLRAYLPDISRQLGPYVGLIITNCIVMGRTEAFGLANPPGLAFIDGVSAGLGYSFVLLIIAVVRELMGSGTLLGIRVLGPWWTNWSIMVMAPGAFFLLAIVIWVVQGLHPEGGEEMNWSTLGPAAVFFGAIFTNNILLTNFLGMCSFLAISREVKSAVGLGAAVVFVMTMTNALNWPVYYYILVPLDLDVPGLHRLHHRHRRLRAARRDDRRAGDRAAVPALGIFLPLITVNCAVFGAVLFMIIRKYTFLASLAYGLGGGLGWTLAIVAMAGIRAEDGQGEACPRGSRAPASR